MASTDDSGKELVSTAEVVFALLVAAVVMRGGKPADLIKAAKDRHAANLIAKTIMREMHPDIKTRKEQRLFPKLVPKGWKIHSDTPPSGFDVTQLRPFRLKKSLSEKEMSTLAIKLGANHGLADGQRMLDGHAKMSEEFRIVHHGRHGRNSPIRINLPGVILQTPRGALKQVYLYYNGRELAVRHRTYGGAHDFYSVIAVTGDTTITSDT